MTLRGAIRKEEDIPSISSIKKSFAFPSNHRNIRSGDGHFIVCEIGKYSVVLNTFRFLRFDMDQIATSIDGFADPGRRRIGDHTGFA